MQFKRLTADFIELESVDSTNNFAASLLKETKPANGTVILTKRQTVGKGQRGNRWHADPDLNLTFSVILYPQIKAAEVFYLSAVAALALKKALSTYVPDVAIKWPNDLYAGTRKLAGILIENQFRGAQVTSSIVGIGINVNQPVFESGLNATSLNILTGTQFSIDDVLRTCYEQLDFYLDLLMSQQYTLLARLYQEKLLGLNQLLHFSDDAGVFEGVIRGVDASGKLLLERNGSIRKYDLKEIRFLL